jgi:hypothetical protein
MPRILPALAPRTGDTNIGTLHAELVPDRSLRRGPLPKLVPLDPGRCSVQWSLDVHGNKVYTALYFVPQTDAERRDERERRAQRKQLRYVTSPSDW